MLSYSIVCLDELFFQSFIKWTIGAYLHVGFLTFSSKSKVDS